MTSQGHPHAIFANAIRAGNVVAAELAAVEMGRPLDLVEALELTALTALRGRDRPHDRVRARRLSVRWLRRWLERCDGTIDEAAMVAGCLVALGGPGHESALTALRDAAARATSGR